MNCGGSAGNPPYSDAVLKLVWSSERRYFAGRLLGTDRLGSTGLHYPYGESRGTGGMFATYTRDASGLDYAVNRYYSSALGRFTTPDPYMNGAFPGDPASWNRYSYTGGDPVNRNDPGGLMWVCFGNSADGLSLNCPPNSYKYNPLSIDDWDDVHGNGQRIDNPCGTGSMLLPNPWCLVPVVVIGSRPAAPEPRKRTPTMIKATYDCTRTRVLPGVGSVVERDITYGLFDGDGQIFSGTISEHLTLIAGQQKPPEVGAKNPFFDTIAVGPEGAFTVTQTFTASLDGITYKNLTLYDRYGYAVKNNTNTIEALPGGVFVNNQDRPADGKCN